MCPGPNHKPERHFFKVLISLNVWYDLLFQVNIVNKSMEGFTIDIEMASSLLDNCVEYINKYRETGYTDASNSSKEIAVIRYRPNHKRSTSTT